MPSAADSELCRCLNPTVKWIYPFMDTEKGELVIGLKAEEIERERRKKPFAIHLRKYAARALPQPFCLKCEKTISFKHPVLTSHKPASSAYDS